MTDDAPGREPVGARPLASGTVHASCVVVGEDGILIRGPSGSGKSTLARALVDAWSLRGGFAALVGDDRVMLSAFGGRLVARPHPALAGMLEVRGLGILRVAHEPAARVRLVVDRGVPDHQRLPGPDDQFVELPGVRLRRLALGAGTSDAIGVVLLALRGIDDTCMTVPAR